MLIDEDLHREGVDALRPYRAVITGSHPEYSSERDARRLRELRHGGGNVMSMGGNGFYWVISYSAEKPWIMEVRRGENGVRAWQAAPGETTHSTTGEKGGIWRNRGRPPQKLFGTGFTSEGYAGVVSLPPHARRRTARDELDLRRRDARGADRRLRPGRRWRLRARRSTGPT